MKNTKQPKTRWLKQIAAVCLMMLSITKMEAQYNYCFNLISGSSWDNGADNGESFTLNQCATSVSNTYTYAPTDSTTASATETCPVSSTKLVITYNPSNPLSPSFPSTFSFGVQVTDGCGTYVYNVNASTISSISNTINIPITCAVSGDYTVTIYDVVNTATGASIYNFTFGVVTEYYCPDSHTSPLFSCDSKTINFDFIAPQITSSFANHVPAVVTGPFTICQSQLPIVLTASGVGSITSPVYSQLVFSWTGPAGTSPAGGLAHTTYTATEAGNYNLILTSAGFNNNVNTCTDALSTSIIVVATPSVTVSPKTATICSGNSITLTAAATGATVYQWSGGNSSASASITVSPSSTTNYTVISLSGQCTSAPAVATVTVLPAPSFSISASTNLVCSSTPVTLSVPTQSGVTFLWSTGSTATSITVTPTQTTTYSMTETENGCSITKSSTVVVITPVPAEIGIGSAPTTSITTAYQCEFGGTYAQFSSVNSADSYDWSIIGNGADFASSSPAGGLYAFGKSSVVNLAGQTGTGNVYVGLTTYISGCSSATTLTLQPCCVATAGVVPYNSAEIFTGTYSGTYLVTGDLLLDGNITFSGATLEMNPGARIVCGGNLTLNNTHIYACSGMWQGIIFTNDITTSGINNSPVLSITNSLIEDAVYAVNLVNPYDFYSSAPYQNIASTNVNASLNNAWFNRCAVGIANNFDPLNAIAYTSNDTAYQAGTITTATNCVFTCRNGVTMAMMTAKNTGGLASLQAGTLHNYLNTNANYTSFVGIASDVSAFPNSTISSCFFDNVMDGILATTGMNNQVALTVTNCTFQYNNLPTTSANYAFVANGKYCKGQGYNIGPGPYFFNSLTGTGALRAGAGINFFGSSLILGGTTATACNFLNSDYGVISYANINAVANNFTGTNYAGIYLSAINPLNVYGNPAAPTGAYIINKNTFTNHYRQGVSALFMNPATGASLSIQTNTFTIASTLYTNSPTPTYTALPEAISVTGSAQGTASISIISNSINNYQLGITALGAYGTNIKTNVITMYDDNVNYTSFTHGISVTNCNNSVIFDNDVSASYAAAAWKYGQVGIFTSASTNNTIECNTIIGPDVSLECQGSNNVSTIKNNSLQNATLINFWLQSAGYVGPLGVKAGGVSGSTTYPSGYANANIFNNAGSIANGESPYATYCTDGSNGTLSPIYYANTTNQVPTPSGNDAAYSNPPGISFPLGGIYQLAANAPAASTCNPNPINPVNPGGGGGGGRMEGTTNNTHDLTTSGGTSSSATSPELPAILTGNTPYQIAANTLHFGQYDTVACFGNVHDLYRTLLEQGASYYSSDAILSKFMTAMQGTVHEKLVAADSLLVHAGADSTKINAALINNNSFTPQGLHDKYLQAVNNLFAACLKQKHGLTATQIQNLRSIAQLCPYQYGEGVFRARALLSRFDATKYKNSCEQPAFPQLKSTTARLETTDITTIEAVAKTSIFPNPNNGNFTISYSGNAKLLNIEVYNILGALVASQSAATENGNSTTQISGLPEGVYMVRLNGDGALIKTERIIVTK